MIIHHEEHTVYDRETGARKKLPAKEAWALFDELNEEVGIEVMA